MRLRTVAATKDEYVEHEIEDKRFGRTVILGSCAGFIRSHNLAIDAISSGR